MFYKPRSKRWHVHCLPIATGAVIGILISFSILGGCGGSDATLDTWYTLTMQLDTTMPVGQDTLSGAGAYREGSKVNIRANPELGWEFTGWTGDIGTVTNPILGNTEIVMNGNYNITAHFASLSITHSISGVVLEPQWPATLNYGERVKIGFDYSTNDTIAVYIFMHPLTNGTITPAYLSSGKSFYQPWQHKGESEFTVSAQAGQVVVDQLRFQIINIYQSEIIYEIFVPVSYTFQ